MKKLLKLSMLISGFALGGLASGSAIAQGACSVNYTAVNSWGSGAQIKTTITNTGAAKTSWELCWTYSGNDIIANLWDGTFTQTGKNVCVKNAGYNGNLPVNGTASFGFTVNNLGTSPTAFTLNGVACGGSSASSVATSSVATSTSTSASSSSTNNNTGAARWLLDATNSTFHFVTVKKNTVGTETAENMTFNQLQGTVSSSGQATLTIPLASINSGNTTRDGRLQGSYLFEADHLPNLHFTTQLSLTTLESMATGGISVQNITGNLVLHGVVKAINFDVRIIKHANNSISVSPVKPIIINSADFDLAYGVESLRVLMSLVSIGERVPVYFKMFLTNSNPNNTQAISLATAPATPLSLTGTAVTSGASLNWADASATESGFLVRRKAADGRWATASKLNANSVSYLDALTTGGSYDYKVISYTDSVPSTATSAITVVYGSIASSSSSTSNSTTSVSSSSRSSGSSTSGGSSSSGVLVGDVTRGATLWTQRSCVACHGVDGEKNANGTPAAQPLNANRSLYQHSNDTQARSLRDFIAMWMPQGSEGSCTGQCAADLEAYIRTWQEDSDGVPENPVSTFSCPSNASTYGQRELRLLTKLEYQRSIRDLVNYQTDLVSSLPDDFISGAFVNNNTLSVNKSRLTSYYANAERIAADVATRWSSVLGCTPSSSCANTLVNTLGPKVFRRPLTSEEQTAYLNVANGTSGSRTVAEGMQIALATMLSAPQFLYRSEIGEMSSNGVYKLTGYEMATYLSYTFTGTTPNATLISAAANGSLNTASGIRTQAATLLNSANTKLLLGDLVNRWLMTERLEGQTKTAFSNFATLGTAMKAELSKNFASAMLDSSSTFASLYLPNYTHVNSTLASHYGLPFSGSQDSDGFVKVSTTDRGGILLSGAFMSRYATTTDSNMITRAVAVRRKLMCQDIPEPPAGVSLDREALAARDKAFYESPTTTQRMIFDRITGGTSCSNCHGEIINPLGGGMENFDTVGRIRTTDLKGNAIVDSGTFYSPYPQLQFMNDPDRVIHSPAIVFDGARDLARTMVEHPVVSQQAQTCLATQFMSYSSGINSIFLIDTDRNVGYTRISPAEEAAYRCGIEDLTNILTTRGPRAMLEEIPVLESVMYRQQWAR
ncbi:MAG TPA: DUF1592 domain-containing protein [Cellvibrio sp.]|nr:DUF1592 domain-containing protein [Cellvibrio sp.]